MRLVKFRYGIDPLKQGFYWPQMQAKRSEYFHAKVMEPTVAQAVYQCDPTARESAVFLPEDFATYYTAPEDLSMGLASAKVAEFCAKGSMVIQAWDTAFSATETSDHSACVTALLIPSESWHNGEDVDLVGPCDPHYLVWILEVLYEKLTFAMVTRTIREQYLKWLPHTVVVEKAAYGSTALEVLARSGIPLEPIAAESNKRARAVEGVGAGSAQGWFRNKRVWMPNNSPEWMTPFVNQMKDFSGKPGGKDDMVDACVHLVRHAIIMGTGASMPPGWQSVEQANQSMGARADGKPWDMFEAIMNMNIDNPQARACEKCAFYKREESWCQKHSRKHVALDTCFDFSPVGALPGMAIAPEMLTYRMGSGI
jgi:phage terminase large subunit-like protein